VTVETEGDYFLVHALAFDDGTMAGLADMDARICATETGGTS